LSSIEDGALAAMFMVGYMVMAPVFGHLARFYRNTTLMAFGLLVWVISALLSGTTKRESECELAPIALSRLNVDHHRSNGCHIDVYEKERASSSGAC